MSAELHWKEKFLEQVDAYEVAEQHWREQAELLRRAVVCSSLAAEGIDTAIDTYMTDLRDALRQDEFTAPMAALLPKLENALLKYEDRRHERLQSIRALLLKLLDHLRELPLPSDQVKQLRQLERKIKKTPPKSQVLPALLKELVHVQQTSLASLGEEQPKAGFLSRWLGFGPRINVELRKREPEPTVVPDRLVNDGPLASTEVVLPDESLSLSKDALDAPVVFSAEPQNAAEALEQTDVAANISEPEPEPEPELQHDIEADNVVNASILESEMAEQTLSEEPVYSSIAEHVQTTLVHFLNELRAPDDFTEKVDHLQQRIRAGLNLYELVAVLDELACLVLEVTDNGADAFESYLLKLNERLNSFQHSLETTGLGYAASISAARDFDQAVNLQVDDLHNCIRDAHSLEALQHSVEERIEAMRQTMSRYQQSVDEHETRVGEHLEDLSRRVARMEQEAKSFQVHLEQQRQLALIDSLTGLPNRLAWNERLQSEYARWQRHDHALVLAIVDVDLFKRINDQFGHLAGDKVLKIIAHELRKRLRQSDFMARFGGEEFVLLLPMTRLSEGKEVLETLRAGVEACPFHFKGERVTITVSAGVAEFSAGDSAQTVFERADQALYEAKKSGRNQVAVA